jgi:hypothetical protein
MQRALGSFASSFPRLEHLGRPSSCSETSTCDDGPSVPNLGRPNPNHANDSRYDSIGDSWYDGLTTFTRRPVLGNVRIAYIIRAFDRETSSSTPQDNNDIPAERGRSDNDQRHRLSVSGTLSSPAQGGGSFWSELARGWLFSGIFTCVAASFHSARKRPQRRHQQRRPADREERRLGFDYQSLDLRLSRTFPLGRWLTFEAILESSTCSTEELPVPNNILGSRRSAAHGGGQRRDSFSSGRA